MHESETSESITKGSPEDKNTESDGKGKSSTSETSGKQKLCSWLNKNFKIEMTDGRVLIGVFLCTDRDGNVILGSCSEYLKPEDNGVIEEPRVLGLVMVPGRHIVSIHLDDITNCSGETM
ncbi:N-alpha-acetyltransferase 38, NatC auxiliary subunit [Zootermopsis nevadensis]|uniref:LSM domain-containing protein 1 n=1 Tax=Zootermopsis nevadensis TaxID=136037 RepID=A0A067RL84_ZOONE|nr:N-alpha-acetyltransferase 38, NatC auxiliary subunit [Zootermopsis nevadensis]KDR21370.1 LSM domain-containing protein 1 [Zootermopsis nevadensis]